MMYVNSEKLPEYWPTHKHSKEFLEHLGRTVATFGFLEEALVKAILSFEGNKTVAVDESEERIEELLNALEAKLKKAITDTLNPLINAYHESMQPYCGDNEKISNDYLNMLIKDLKAAADYRNLLCHASWRTPNKEGLSQAFFIRKRNGDHEIFDTPIGIDFFKQVQKHTAELICNIISTVTVMGWEFPGASTGEKLYE
ncbi:MAG: hypothetical protein ACN2B6_09225 [Rickettsiales bacterium]